MIHDKIDIGLLIHEFVKELKKAYDQNKIQINRKK